MKETVLIAWTFFAIWNGNIQQFFFSQKEACVEVREFVINSPDYTTRVYPQQGYTGGSRVSPCVDLAREKKIDPRATQGR